MADVSVPNFSPLCLSPAWVRARCLPDMLECSDSTVIAVLETGLLFREDALQLEDTLQERSPRPRSWMPLSTGERVLVATALGTCIYLLPFRMPLGSRGNVARALAWGVAGVAAPLGRRLMRPRSLSALLAALQAYAALARRALACLREGSFHARHRKSAGEYLCRCLVAQQRELCALLQSAGAVLPSACPWLPPAWEPLPSPCDDLVKVHHLFLVLQSLFLKTVALAHLTPSLHAARLHKNRNERIHWVHATLLPYVLEPLLNHIVNLETGLRNFKEICNFKEAKFLPKAYNSNRDSWQYSEVHVGITSLNADLSSALGKCNEMDSFLEACWAAKSKFSPEILEDDLSKLRDELMKCFHTVEGTAIKLKKIRVAEMKLLEAAVQKLPLPAVEEEDSDVNANVKTVCEDTDVDVQDQVFYYVKTDEPSEGGVTAAEDYLTGPGKNEIQATKVVLGELRVKLVKREEDMRVREAKALENTMPELKGKVPEFPRQMVIGAGDTAHESEIVIKNGDVNGDQINRNIALSVNAEICESKHKQNTSGQNEISNSEQWNGHSKHEQGVDLKHNHSSQASEDKVAGVVRENLEFFDGDTSDVDSDVDTPNLLKDVRKNRVARKKNHPPSRRGSVVAGKLEADGPVCAAVETCIDDTDEGSQVMEYSFGTGMAMATLFQIPPNGGSGGGFPVVAEEIFIGAGEVSEDSGNED